MNCLLQFSKHVIYVFNFLISLCGIALIIFGVMYILDESFGVNLFWDFFSLGALVISVGVIIFFIAAFGCCGALHENVCLLTTYAIFLLLLCLLQIAVGVLAVVKIINEDDFFTNVKTLVNDLFNNTKQFAKIQSQFNCCGVNGSADYPETINFYPASCCPKGQSPCFEPYQNGCAENFANVVREYIEIIGYVSLAFALIDFCGASFALVIRRAKKKTKLILSKRNTETSI